MSGGIFVFASSITSTAIEDLPDCDQYERRIDSTESISWGDVAFEDPVDRFNFGMLAQRMSQLNIA